MNPSVTKPAAPEPSLEKALDRAFSMGQTYWQQADSESYSQNKKSDVTLQRFRDFKAETVAALKPAVPEPDSVHQVEPGSSLPDAANEARQYADALHVESLHYGTCDSLEDARMYADEVQRNGLRGRYPAALVVMDMAFARIALYLSETVLSAADRVTGAAEADEQQSAAVPAPVEPTALEVLQELVTLKDMSVAAESGKGIDPECNDYLAEYRRRKPIAWANARAVLTDAANGA